MLGHHHLFLSGGIFYRISERPGIAAAIPSRTFGGYIISDPSFLSWKLAASSPPNFAGKFAGWLQSHRAISAVRRSTLCLLARPLAYILCRNWCHPAGVSDAYSVSHGNTLAVDTSDRAQYHKNLADAKTANRIRIMRRFWGRTARTTAECCLRHGQLDFRRPAHSGSRLERFSG